MKYFMSEKTAQFVRGMMEREGAPKSLAVGTARRTAPSDVTEDSFAHPFELRWAASSGEGGAGAWIVWLPPGSLVTDGTEASTADLTAAAGYPAGWYDLTSIFGESDVPESFDLFLDVGEKFVFTTDRAAAANPVLVASVTGKTVKGVVESALVFSAGAPHPWELRRFYDAPETEGGESVPVWRVWIPRAALLFVWGTWTRDVVYDSGTGQSVITEPGVSAGSWGSAEYTGEIDAERTAAAVASGLDGKWVKVTPGESGELFACVTAASAATISQPTVTLTGMAPQDSTVNHPSSLTQGGIYIRIADVDSAGVVTQHLSSLAVLTVYSGGVVQKLIAGGDGITVTESNGRITISATGSGSGSGGGSTGGGEDSGTGISGTFVFATVPHYDEGSHQLLYTPVSLTFANGRLTAMETGAETVIAQAVEESA